MRLFLGGVPELTPTLPSLNNKFSVKYFLSIAIIDEMNRKYFKNSEIKFGRAETG